jgi:hypothetical protein
VELNVTNFPPEAQSDRYSIPPDKVFNLPAPGVLGNDDDFDGDALTAKLDLAPKFGQVVFNSDGSFSYTPNPGFAGHDNFTYTVSDGVWPSAPISVELNVTNFPTNQPPQANSDRYNTPHDKTLNVEVPGVLANDIDADGDPLSATLQSVPSNGKVNFNPDGSFSYTPNPGFVGFDNFTYTVSDGTFTSGSAEIRINVTNQPPQPNSDRYNTPHDKTLNVEVPGVLANDIDADGDPLSATLQSLPSNGKVNFNPDGSFSYTPIRVLPALTTSATVSATGPSRLGLLKYVLMSPISRRRQIAIVTTLLTTRHSMSKSPEFWPMTSTPTATP